MARKRRINIMFLRETKKKVTWFTREIVEAIKKDLYNGICLRKIIILLLTIRIMFLKVVSVCACACYVVFSVETNFARQIQTWVKYFVCVDMAGPGENKTVDRLVII